MGSDHTGINTHSLDSYFVLSDSNPILGLFNAERTSDLEPVMEPNIYAHGVTVMENQGDKVHSEKVVDDTLQISHWDANSQVNEVQEDPMEILNQIAATENQHNATIVNIENATQNPMAKQQK